MNNNLYLKFTNDWIDYFYKIMVKLGFVNYIEGNENISIDYIMKDGIKNRFKI